MLVHLPRLHLNAFTDIPVDEFEQIARLDRFGEHHLTDDPETSDLILFAQCHMIPTDWRLTAIRDHPLSQRYRSKVLVYDERDRPWCSSPGVYVSMPARDFDREYQRPWGYFRVPEIIRPPENREHPPDPDLLFSFVGSPSAPCRKPLFRLRHADAYVDEVHRFTFYDTNSPNFTEKRASYQDVLARSRFVLCPRGRGTSSFRLHETLAAGRVPVIISDDWVAPDGPDWDSFSIRWPERAYGELIDMLEERDRDWAALSAQARAAHTEYFARDTSFHRVIELCRDLSNSRSAGDFQRSRSRNRTFIASGADVARWRTTSAVRRLGRQVVDRRLRKPADPGRS